MGNPNDILIKNENGLFKFLSEKMKYKTFGNEFKNLLYDKKSKKYKDHITKEEFCDFAFTYEGFKKCTSFMWFLNDAVYFESKSQYAQFKEFYKNIIFNTNVFYVPYKIYTKTHKDETELFIDGLYSRIDEYMDVFETNSVLNNLDAIKENLINTIDETKKQYIHVRTELYNNIECMISAIECVDFQYLMNAVLEKEISDTQNKIKSLQKEIKAKTNMLKKHS